MSVAGVEWRNGGEKIAPDTAKNMFQDCAENWTRLALHNDIGKENRGRVLLPVGLGVFLPESERSVLSKCIYTGMAKAIKEALTSSPERVIHITCPEAMYTALKDNIRDDNMCTRFQLVPGADALVLAQQQQCPVVNAGDSDWIVAADPTKGPGQWWRHHCLVGGNANRTSDEMVALRAGGTFEFANLRNLGDSIVERITSLYQTTSTLGR